MAFAMPAQRGVGAGKGKGHKGKGKGGKGDIGGRKVWQAGEKLWENALLHRTQGFLKKYCDVPTFGDAGRSSAT
jgi:hypothetical protein